MEQTIPTFEEGDRLRKAREHAGLTSQQMADRLGVNRSTVSAYENGGGKRGVPRSVIISWSLITDVPVEWLETGAVDLRERTFPCETAVSIPGQAELFTFPEPNDPQHRDPEPFDAPAAA